MTNDNHFSKATLALNLKDNTTNYTRDDAYAASLDYFKGDTLAANVFVDKYALQDKEGNYLELTPSDMHGRLAREFARIEAKYDNGMTEEEIFSYLADWRIVAQGSPMSGVGNPYRMQTFSNCYVVESPEDSYGGIMRTDQELTQIMKRRGGVGVDLSTLRPRGLSTNNAAKTTDGLGIFMERYSNTTREVAQGGRRGALMLTTSVHHPDIYRFMRIKNELTACKKCGHEERTKVTGANVSIRLSDEFLNAVEKDNEVELRWPVDASEPQVSQKVSAREMWDEIIQHARDSAEPGLLFWDNVIRESPADIYAEEGYRTVCTNPCAELPLSVGDSCRLLLLNLSKFVVNPFTAEAKFDYSAFHVAARKAQRLMDDLVDLELEQISKVIAKIKSDPEDEDIKQEEMMLWERIYEACRNGRRTGLGVTAVGDTVAMLNVKYGTPESVEVIEELYKNLAVASYVESVNLAKERGSFPVFDLSKEKGHPYLERVLDAADEKYGIRADYEKYGRRQIANLTTAPTGSTSILTQTSGGIEPVFMAQYKRRKKINPNEPDAEVNYVDAQGDAWTDFIVSHHGLQLWKDVTGKGDEDFEESPYAGAQAQEIDWEIRVDIQAAAGTWVDHSISSTVNLPFDVSNEVVASIYERAWKKGCKGITVYRDGARDGVLMSSDEKSADGFHTHDAPRRPERLECDVHRSRMKYGEDYADWTIFVGLMDGKPYEIFGGYSENIELPRKVTSGWIEKRSYKSGGKYDFCYGDIEDPSKIKDIVKTFDNPNQGSFTRMLSLSLRHGAAVQHVVEQLQRDREADMFSFAKVMARVLKKYIEDGTSAGRYCPDCGAEGTLIYTEGCVSCTACGSSKCG